MEWTQRQVGLGLPAAALPFPAHAARVFDVTAFGACGDGRTLDTAAFNAAIEAASRSGGGTVLVPAGRYLCSFIRLKSRITIQRARGAVIEAADPARHALRRNMPPPIRSRACLARCPPGACGYGMCAGSRLRAYA